MTKSLTVAVLIGSLREASLSRRVAHALEKLAPAGVSFKLLEIGDLPLYNEDLETSEPPLPWQRFRVEIAAADAVLFVTPEYNRSVPAPLKNAVDVGSRPYGKNVWDSLPGAVVSISQGGIGGFGANHHLRQSLVCLNVLTMHQPEAYIGNAASLFTDRGEFAKPETSEFLKQFVTAFIAWAHRNRR